MRNMRYMAIALGALLLPALACGEDLAAEFQLQDPEGSLLAFETRAVPAGGAASAVLPLDGRRVREITAFLGRDPRLEGGRRRGLIVGINRYSYTSPDLNGCVGDAISLRNMLVSGGAWRSADLELLTDFSATHAAIRGAMARQAQELEPGDRFVYVHSGHGGDDPQHVCCNDASYYAEELGEDLAAFRDGVKIAVIMDACFCGGMFDPEEFVSRTMECLARCKAARRGLTLAAARMNAAQDVAFLAACTKEELSYETEDGGFFACALAEAARDPGSDADKNGLLDFKELFDAAVSRMLERYGDLQTPVLKNPEVARAYFMGTVNEPLPEQPYGFALDGAGESISLAVSNVCRNVKLVVRAGWPCSGGEFATNVCRVVCLAEGGAEKACLTQEVERCQSLRQVLEVPGYYPYSLRLSRDLSRFREIQECQALCVGVDEYVDGTRISPRHCRQDADTWRYFLDQGGVWLNDGILVKTNAAATKAAVRGALRLAGETLMPGDRYCYYHSARGEREGDDSRLGFYDGTYSPEELAEDFGRFRPGVRVAIVLEGDYCGGMVPAGWTDVFAAARAAAWGLSPEEAASSLAEDVTFLLACGGNERAGFNAGYGGFFTSALAYGGLVPAGTEQVHSLLLAEDFDGLLDFWQIFDRASLVLAGYSQHSALLNAGVAAGQLCSFAPEGSAEVAGGLDGEGRILAFLDRVNADWRVEMTVESTEEPYGNADILALSSKTTLKGGEERDKFSARLLIYGAGSLNVLPQDLARNFCFNGVRLPLGGPLDIINPRNAVYRSEGADFQLVTRAKANLKKRQIMLKIAGSGRLGLSAMASGTGRQPLNLIWNNHSYCILVPSEITAKSTPKAFVIKKIK